MNRIATIAVLALAAVGFGAHSPIASAAGTAVPEVAAEVDMLTGQGTVSGDDGVVRGLKKGDKVRSGEVVSAGVNSYVNLKFRDGAFILIRPNSRFQVESWHMPAGMRPKANLPPPADKKTDPKAAATSEQAAAAPADPGAVGGKSFFRMLKGGFRAVSGAIGSVDRSEYQVATPVATIGIRGTDYVSLICDAACAADPIIRSGLTGEQGQIAEGGIVVAVSEGAIIIDSAGKNCDNKEERGKSCIVKASQNLLVTTDGSQYRLSDLPKFLRDDPMPDPRSCGG